MREILFRGKRTDDGEWVEGLLYKEFNNFYNKLVFNIQRINKFGIPIAVYEIEPKTVGQYTGLTDKNGKKIFEGDIILFEDESPTNYEYHDVTEMRCGEIKFDGGEFYLTNRIAVEMYDLVYDNKLDGQIVGNIHDNPELLKGE